MGIFDFLFGKKQEPEKERGTVVYQSPQHKVGEVGGITVTSSVFIKKFTEEEIRENAKDNRWFYEPAYKQVTQTIEAGQGQIDAMFDELLVAFTAGDARREQKIVEQFLPDGTWRWPAYEAFALPRDEEYYRECLEELQSSTLFDLLMMLKAQQLRALYKEFTGNKAKSPGRKKAEITTALIELLSPEHNIELTERRRAEEIACLALPGTPDYKEMVSLLFRRIATIAYGIRHKSQMREIADRYPIWEFRVHTHYDTPEECIKRNGKRYRHDDPIWGIFPPCENLKCGCHIAVVFDRDKD